MRVHPTIRAGASMALAAALTLTATVAVAAGVSHAWTHEFGRGGTDIAHAVVVGADRNVFVAGRIQTDRGDDCFVRKYRPDGSRRWMRIFGTPRGDYCRGAALAPNGSIYVAGSTHGSLAGPSAGGEDAFVRKYRPDGSVAWTQQFGSSASEQVYAVAVDGGGNVFLAGHTLGDLDGRGNRGGWDAYVTKLRPNGRLVWTRQFGTTVDDFGMSVAVSPSGKIVIAGQTFGGLGAPYRGAGDAFVRKLRPGGGHLWTRQIGTLEREIARGVTVSADDRIYVVGSTAGALPGQTAHGQDDGFIRKLRPDGSSIWTRQFGTPGPDGADEVRVDSAGRVYLTGEIHVVSIDAYVMKMKPNGTPAWIKKTGSGASHDGGRSVAVDRLRHVYLAGLSDGPLAGQTWSGSWDAWVRKYRP